MGQQYKTPEEVITQGADLIVVGRAIYATPDPAVRKKVFKYIFVIDQNFHLTYTFKFHSSSKFR